MSYFYYQRKKIYYTEAGKGEPVLFLHGNTASSKMFELLMPLYEERFHVILIDFLGHGKSERLEEFPADLWIEEARQTVALLEHLKLGRVNLVGTSGGAWVAINAALERPELVGKVVADSFDGRTLADDFSENLIQERRSSRQTRWQLSFIVGARERTGSVLWIWTQRLWSNAQRKSFRYSQGRLAVCRLRSCLW